VAVGCSGWLLGCFGWWLAVGCSVFLLGCFKWLLTVLSDYTAVLSGCWLFCVGTVLF